MTTCDARRSSRARGFTLVEVVVVLAVLGLLLGAAMPLAGAIVDSNRRQEARAELAEIGAALDAYCFEHAAFPAQLNAIDFLGVHLQPGVGNTATLDPFGAGQPYRYTLDTATHTATVHSVGENGVDDGPAAEELVVRVHAAVPGSRKTWLMLRLAIELLATHIESGGSVTGPWPDLRQRIGLQATFDVDGFGLPWRWDALTHALTSAGPDRTFGTADDITL